MTGALCSAKLRTGDPCRSVATNNEFCAYHAALADEFGHDVIAYGDQTKKRNARRRAPVVAQSQPLALNPSPSKSPSAVRPALALTAVEELETIRSVLLEAATSTTRETWATCTCPECGKGFRQEISAPDHGARIKAIETLLREGLGRVGEADEPPTPRVPRTVADIRRLSTEDLEEIVASDDEGVAWLIRSHLRPLGVETRDALRAALDEMESEGEPVSDLAVMG